LTIGLAVVGAGKIGRHRARLAKQHAGVSFLAIADIDGEAAKRLADEVQADTWSTNVSAIAGIAEVDAVVISTPEMAHSEPLLAVLPFGKPTLVEKPITLTLADADAVIQVANECGADLRVGYSMRYAQRYAVAKEQLQQNQIGQLIGGLARTYDTLAVAEAILSRSPTASPVMDILTYIVDVIGWYHPDARPVEVTARSNGSILRSRGHQIDDLTFAVITYDDGAVFDLATSYSLPAGYPTNGLSTRFELFGTDGVLFITEDHGDQVMYTEAGFENAYVDQTLNLAYLGSRTSGEWAGGRMFGRVADETRAWLDHLSVGGPCHLTTADEARTTLSVTLAIDEAATTGQVISLIDDEDTKNLRGG